MLEVALYALDGTLIIHPRVIARTTNLERTVVLLRSGSNEPTLTETDDSAMMSEGGDTSTASEERARWWPNNLIAPLPISRIWLSAYRSKVNGGECGVFLSGRKEKLRAVTGLLEEGVLTELPDGTAEGRQSGLIIHRLEAEFPTVEDEQIWLADTLKTFANVLRPRLKRLDRKPTG